MSSTWEKNKPETRHFWIRLTIAIGLVLIVAAAFGARQSSGQLKTPASASQTTESQAPALNGTWKLNRDESDDPREKLRSAIQDRDQNGSPGGMGRRGGMGGGVGMGIPGMGGGMGGGMGRRGGVQGGGSGSDEQHARLRDLIQAPDQVSVAQKGPEIDVTDTENHMRALFTDGRKLDKPKKDSAQTQVKARWDHGTLVTEEKGPSGEKVSHSYEITNQGKQLADTLTLESKRLNTPVIIRYVYDKAE